MMNRSCELALLVIAISVCCAARTPAPPAADDRVTVKDVVFEGSTGLSSSQIDEVKSSVAGRQGTTEELMDTVRQALNSQLTGECYLRPGIELSIVYRADAASDGVVMRATVQHGTRYQLNKFRVEWARAYSARDIEPLLPIDAMRRGDCKGLDDLKSTVTDFYQKHGYGNVKVNSLIQPNGTTRQFDLTLYIDEGSR